MRQIDTEATRRLHERANSGPARHWLTKLSVAPVSANSVRVVAPDNYILTSCRDRYGAKIENWLRQDAPDVSAVKWVVDNNVATPTPPRSRTDAAESSVMDEAPFRDAPARKLIAPTLPEFETMPIPPREFLLAPWLPRRGLAMVYGPRGGGKTWLAWSIAMAVASGSELFGKWAAPRPGRVVYVDGELPAGVIRDRMTTAKRGRSGGELADDAIRVIAADMQPEGLRSLDSAEGQRDLDPYLEGADLVIFDNLSALTACRENEADDWAGFQSYLLSLRRRGLSALLIHHAGKGGQQRGTSRREDVLDSVIALRKPPDHDPRAGAAFDLHFEKSRGFWGDDAAPFGLRFDVGSDGGACWTVTDVDAGDAQRCRAREMKASGSSLRDIAAAMGTTKSTVGRWLAG